MVDAKFITGTCDGIIECLSEADINQSGGSEPTCDDITIGDISYLLDYLFITGPTLGLSDCLVLGQVPADSCRPCGTDLGDPDSVYFHITMPESGGSDSLVIAELYVFNDVQNVASMSMGFSWDHPYLEMDSAVWSPEAETAFNMIRLGYFRGGLDYTNAYQLFQCVGLRLTGNGLIASGQAKAVVSYYFHLNDLTGSDSICINLEDFNKPYFVDQNNEEYEPQWVAMCDVIPNLPPVLNPIGAQSVNETELLEFIVVATDADGTTPVLSTGTLPSDATFANNGDGTGSFNWSPNPFQIGSHQVTFYATDGLDTDSEAVTIEVFNTGNQGPELNNIGYSGINPDQLLVISVSATDPDADSIILSVGALPSGASFADNYDGTGQFLWTPSFVQIGIHQVMFYASDGVFTDSESVNIYVVDPSQDPLDLGSADSILMEIVLPDDWGTDSTFAVKLYCFNDVQNIGPISSGFSWDNPDVKMDLAVWSPEAMSAFNMVQFSYYRNSLDSTNANQLFQATGLCMFGDGLVASSERKLVVTYYFHVEGWTPDAALCINLADFNILAFVDQSNNEYTPIWSGSECVSLQPSDSDDDGVPNSVDNCPTTYNPGQEDVDNDSFGDICDNCPNDYNPDQADADSNGVGDVCEAPSAPVLAPSSTLPFSGTACFDPTSGNESTLFEFRINYTDASNLWPAAGYPQLLIDWNSDGLMDHENDGYYQMSPSMADSVFTDGADYSVFLALPPYGNPQIRFEVENTDGLTAEYPVSGWLPGPSVVGPDSPDLYVYADDILYSIESPEVWEPIVISARVHNNSADAQSSVDINLYIDDVIVASYQEDIPARTVDETPGFVDITFDTIFDESAFLEVKVAVDPDNNIVEWNEGNNSASRSLFVGDYGVPGSIEISASVLGSYYPQAFIRSNGSAWYEEDGTFLRYVAGAPAYLTLLETGENLGTVYVNDNGYFSYGFTAPSVTGSYNLQIIVTDFTLTYTAIVPFQVVPFIPSPGVNLVIDFDLNGQPLTTCGSSILSIENAVVRNVGTSASGSFKAYIKQDGNTLWDETVTSLAAGAIYEFPDAPKEITHTEAGLHSITGYVDYDHEVAESSESDNYRSKEYGVWCCLPDLNPNRVMLGGATYANIPLNIQTRVRNLGSQDVSDFSLALNDSWWNGSRTITLENLSISAYGAEDWFTFSGVVFADTGWHQLQMVVDPSNTVTECDPDGESNNIYTINIYVAETPRPDLFMHSDEISMSSLNPDLGESVCLLNADIYNVGEYTAYDVEVIFTFDNVLLGDTILDSIPNYGSDNYRSCQPQECVSVDSCNPRTHIFEVCVDPVHLIEELNDRNNCATKSVIFCSTDTCLPIADFTSDVQHGCAPLIVNFTDLSSLNGPASWYWDFGDGETSSEQNATHEYWEGGTYTLNLTVTDSCGTDQITMTDYITVDPYGYNVRHVSTTTGDDISGDGSLGNPFATIQRGIDAACHGDTVMVAPGNYTGEGNRDISTLGKAILVRSADGAEHTNIVCDPVGAAFDGFLLEDTHEDTNTVIDGFTITGFVRGVNLQAAAPKLTNLVITASSGNGLFSDWAYLAGSCPVTMRSCEFSGPSDGVRMVRSMAIVDTCRFLNNGTGLSLGQESGANISRSRFDNNSVGVNSIDTYSVANVTISSSTFIGNGKGVFGIGTFTDCRFQDGGCGIEGPEASWPAEARYSAIRCTFENLSGTAAVVTRFTTLEDCTFRRNTGELVTGFAIEEDLIVCSISNCTFEDNVGGLTFGVGETHLSISGCAFSNTGPIQWTSLHYGDCVISGSQFYNCPSGVVLSAFAADRLDSTQTVLSIAGCLFANNLGTVLQTDCSANITECTFVNNGGDAVVIDQWASGIHTQFSRNIVAFNSGCGLIKNSSELVTANIECCNVYENAGGNYCGEAGWATLTDVISLDPLFCNASGGNYHLDACSPCTPDRSPCGVLIGALDVNCSGAYCGPVWHVAIGGNDTTGDGSASNPFATIQHGIDVAIDMDTVMVAPGTYTGEGNWGIDFSGKQIVLLSESGPDVTTILSEITGSPRPSGVSLVSSESNFTVIEGLWFQQENGYDDLPDSGGAIYCDGSSPTIRNCVFSNLCVDEYGRGDAVFLRNSNTLIDSCRFVSNGYMRPSSRGGGGIYSEDSDLRLRLCSFEGNKAWVAGGGLFLLRSSATIDSCMFSGNDAHVSGAYKTQNSASLQWVGWGGGAIACESSQLYAYGCSFNGNYTEVGSGGAIGADDASTLELDSCTLSGNECGYGLPGPAYGLGGAVNGNGTFRRCLFSGNKVLDGKGGAFHGSGAFEDCTFAGNQALPYSDGGAVSGSGTFDRCEFRNNQSDQSGGAVLGSGTFTDCLFAGNYAGDPEGWYFTGNGGVVYGTGSFAHCTFVQNRACYGSSLYLTDENSVLTECVVVSSSRSDTESTDPVKWIEGCATLTCCDVYGNEGGDWIGCIADQYGTNGNFSLNPLFCEGDFHLDACSPCSPDRSPCGELIGALDVNCSDAYCGPVWHVAIDGNDTTGDGSESSPFATIQHGIDVAIDADTVLVHPGDYTGNGNWDIDFHGKSIVVKSESGPELTSVVGSLDGSAFHFQNGEDTTSVLSGFGVTSTWAASPVTRGNGLRCIAASPYVVNCIFRNLLYGGAVYLENASPVFDNCLFDSNQSGTTAYKVSDEKSLGAVPGGGGIYCNSGSNPIIRYCQFVNNVTDGRTGAAIACYASAPTITDCQFVSNEGHGRGGAIICADGSDAIVQNCRFESNHSEFAYGPISEDGSGGAVAIEASSPQFTNCGFWDNSSLATSMAGLLANGGAIFCDNGATPIFTGCTIVKNHTVCMGDPQYEDCADDPYAIYLKGASVAVFENCIIAFNDYDYQTYRSGGIGCADQASLVNLTCSDVYGNGLAVCRDTLFGFRIYVV